METRAGMWWSWAVLLRDSLTLFLPGNMTTWRHCTTTATSNQEIWSSQNVSGEVGGAAGSQGWGAGEVGAKPPVGMEPWGRPASYLSAAQPWRRRTVQPIDARQYLSLGGNKTHPVGLIQKATTTLTPQNLLSIVHLLYLI